MPFWRLVFDTFWCLVLDLVISTLSFKYFRRAKCLIYIKLCTFHVLKKNSARLQWYSCARHKAPGPLVDNEFFCILHSRRVWITSPYYLGVFISGGVDFQVKTQCDHLPTLSYEFWIMPQPRQKKSSNETELIITCVIYLTLRYLPLRKSDRHNVHTAILYGDNISWPNCTECPDKKNVQKSTLSLQSYWHYRLF